MPTTRELEVRTLGACRFDSPLLGRKKRRFVSDERRIRLEDELAPGAGGRR